MREASPPSEFDLYVLAQLEKLFEAGELEVQVGRPFKPGAVPDPGKTNMAVIVKHVPTGKKTSCDKYQSQITNKITCLLTLLLDTPRSS
jgi:protein subunit release factor A